MSQIIRTEAVVLRTMPFRETSQIVTLFTREKGKITVLAKGARKLKSQFGATLQTMAHIQAIFYYKPTRSLQTLSETAHLTVLNRITSDLDKISAGMRMIEMVNALMQDEEQNPQVLNLLTESLIGLDEADVNMANLWPYFQLRLAGCLGFLPAIDRDDVHALPEKGGLLMLDTGGMDAGKNASSSTVAASRTTLRAFAILARAKQTDIMRLTLKPEIMHEVSELIERYLKYHIEEALPTRSDRVIGQLSDPRIGL